LTLTRNLLNSIDTIEAHNPNYTGFLLSKNSFPVKAPHTTVGRIIDIVKDDITIPRQTVEIHCAVVKNTIEISFFQAASRHYDENDFISTTTIDWTKNNDLTVVVSDIVSHTIPSVVSKIQKEREAERIKKALQDEKDAILQELFPAL